MSSYSQLQGIDAEIMDYLRNHPEPKDCSVTQMIKGGAVRKKAALSRKFLKKHLSELEEKNLIYSLKVQDPVRKVEYVYYTLKPTCEETGVYGVPKYLKKQMNYYEDILGYFYGELRGIHTPLMGDYCALCKEFEKVLAPKERVSCTDFLLIFSNWHVKPCYKWKK